MCNFSIAILVCGFHPVLNWKVFQSIASYDNLILKLDFVAVVSFVIDRIVCTAIFRLQEYFDRLDIFDFIFLNFCPVFFYFFLISSCVICLPANSRTNSSFTAAFLPGVFFGSAFQLFQLWQPLQLLLFLLLLQLFSFTASFTSAAFSATFSTAVTFFCCFFSNSCLYFFLCCFFVYSSCCIFLCLSTVLP